MTDFTVRSDNIDVEQIMRQIRARIREKRGVDYTEEEVRELARVKLERFLDPGGVRSDLLEHFRKVRTPSPPLPNYAFEDSTLFDSHRGLIRWIRTLLRPILKLFFNPNPLISALHIQSELNSLHAAANAAANAAREHLEALNYELLHNLVLETTKLAIDVKNLKMRVESMSSRLDFDERRAKALEGVVQYRPGAVPPLQPPGSGEAIGTEAEQAERQARRRRRRGRRRPADARNGSSPGSGEGQRPRGQEGDRSSPQPGAAAGGPSEGGAADVDPSEGGASHES